MTAGSSSRTYHITDEENEATDTPFPTLLEAKERTKRAKEYEGKVKNFLNLCARMSAGNSSTVADSATILAYGPPWASKAGDLADHDERVRRAIDLLASGTDNPYASFALATIPMFLQFMRNHENAEVKAERRIRVPFSKRTFRLPFRLRIKLNGRAKNMTMDPNALVNAVFSDPTIRAQFEKDGIQIAYPNNMNGQPRA
jgi:hypothetical protein